MGCKFYFQNAWGGEFSNSNQLTVAAGSESLIKVLDSGNIEFADGASLEEGATYVLTVDLTAGVTKGVVSLRKISDGEVKPEPVVVQTFYFDFGSITAAQGTVTEGPDANNHYWNNITNNESGNKYAAAGTVYSPLVNSENAQTDYALTLDVRFSTNGKSGGGGLLEPQADLLNDLAVASATEDYFFTEQNENEDRSFTFSGNSVRKYSCISVYKSFPSMTISSIPSMYTFFKSDIYVGGADFKREKATLDNAVFNNFLYSSFRRSISSSTS